MLWLKGHVSRYVTAAYKTGYTLGFVIRSNELTANCYIGLVFLIDLRIRAIYYSHR